MATYFQSQWRRPPTPEEFGRLVENKVREEVLYREALAMGLDKDDTIVKRRMAQKMQFLAEDVAAARRARPGGTRDLVSQEHATSSRLPGRISFRQIYFSPDRRGARARDDADEGAGEARGPAGRFAARRVVQRSLHAAGLLRRSLVRRSLPRSSARRSRRRCSGPSRAPGRADRIRFRLAPRVRRLDHPRARAGTSPRSSPR